MAWLELWATPSRWTMADLGLKGRRGLHIAHWNIRSLEPTLDFVRLTLLLNTLDILTISETWLHENIQDNELEIEGYRFYRFDRDTGKRAGGICVYAKPHINIDEIKFKDLNASNNDLEILWLKVKAGNYKTIILGTCYRPPRDIYMQVFCQVRYCTKHISRKRKGKRKKNGG